MIDHRICNLCRKVYYDENNRDSSPILRYDFGPNSWFCPFTKKSVAIPDKDPPDGCVYSLEQLMYNQRSWKMWLKEWWYDHLSDFGVCEDKRFPLK